MNKSQLQQFIREEVRSILGNESINEVKKDKHGNHLEPQFKKGDKVTYLGNKGVITGVNKGPSGVYSYNVSYDKGSGRTKASNISNKNGNDIKLESVNEAANTNLELKNMAKQLYLGFKKMGADVELATDKVIINKAKEDDGKLGHDKKNVWISLHNDSKGDYLRIILVGDKAISFEDKIKNDPAFSKFNYIENPGPLASLDGTTWGGQKIRYMYFRPGATS